MTVMFVDEGTSNHHRDLSCCLAFIDKAAEVGCGAVKFQLFRVRDLFAPEIILKTAVTPPPRRVPRQEGEAIFA